MMGHPDHIKKQAAESLLGSGKCHAPELAVAFIRNTMNEYIAVILLVGCGDRALRLKRRGADPLIKQINYVIHIQRAFSRCYWSISTSSIIYLYSCSCRSRTVVSCEIHLCWLYKHYLPLVLYTLYSFTRTGTYLTLVLAL